MLNLLKPKCTPEVSDEYLLILLEGLDPEIVCTIL